MTRDTLSMLTNPILTAPPRKECLFLDIRDGSVVETGCGGGCPTTDRFISKLLERNPKSCDLLAFAPTIPVTFFFLGAFSWIAPSYSWSQAGALARHASTILGEGTLSFILSPATPLQLWDWLGSSLNRS